VPVIDAGGGLGEVIGLLGLEEAAP